MASELRRRSERDRQDFFLLIPKRGLHFSRPKVLKKCPI